MSARSTPQSTKPATPAPSTPEPNPEFSHPAASERIAATVAALEGRGIHALVVGDRDEARRTVLGLIPPGSAVLDATSQTLQATGIAPALREAGRYRDVRAEVARLALEGKTLEQRRAGAAPEYVVGSVHAVTEAGQVVIASATGSQLAPYAYGAAHVIWVVGAQKIVPSLDEAFRRLREYSLPLEDRRALVAYGVNSALAKTLIIEREAQPGRITMVIVRENLGF